MIGKLGNDSFGTQLRANLESAGVDTASVGVESTSSGIAQIITAGNGENVIVVIPGANAHVSSHYLEKHLDVIRTASIVLTQLEIPLETVEYLGSITRKEGIPLMLDPAPARPLPSSLLECVEWLTPNESETCSLLGLQSQDVPEASMEEVAEILLQRGSRNVLLKLGQRGCFLALADSRRVFLPAYAVRAIDSTAAGDAFNGAFASALIEGHDPVRCATWASAVAAISVTRADGKKPVLLVGNRISSPGTMGVHVTESAVTARDNTITGARLDAEKDMGDAFYAVDSRLVIEQNVMRGNAGSGVAAVRSQLRLRGNGFIENGRAGLLLLDASRGSVTGNNFERNQTAGVELGERSRATLDQNRFGGNVRLDIDTGCGRGLAGKAEIGEGNVTKAGVLRQRTCAQ